MKLLTKLSTLLMCLTFLSFSQPIDNVQFTTLDGESYDLYEILESGKHVFVHAGGAR